MYGMREVVTIFRFALLCVYAISLFKMKLAFKRFVGNISLIKVILLIVVSRKL